MALRLSPKWIQSFLKLEASAEQMAAMLSQSGLETEVIDDITIDPKIVIGDIISVEPHPNAEKLNVCQVALGAGQKPVTIVCGCPTVVNAKKVIVAQVGAQVAGMTISRVSLRGIDSEGMICSLGELGIVEDAKGIYHVDDPVSAGTKLIDWIEHDTQLLEIDITPNRGDCLSVYGIARDLAASQDKALVDYPKGLDLSTVGDEHLFDMKSQDVPAYAAMQLEINPKKQAPLFMINRLRQAGMGSNHLVVDILNYVMLEIGQPMHGFNQESLALPLVIKDKTEAPCLLLDLEVYNTQNWDLLVCDQKGPQALAGIMGGYDSRMQEGNIHVQLESAIFAPERIAKSLRRCRLNTDASYRYERGVSIDLNEIALAYAAELLVKHTDAKILNKHCYKSLPKPTVITLDPEFVNNYLGIELAREEMEAFLERLGMSISGSKVTVPHHRHDITIPEDLVEEIARLYGYNNIPLTEMKDTLVPQVIHHNSQDMTKLAMAHMGYHEVVQFSFVSKQLLDVFKVDADAIEIENPIHAEYGFMRTHLWQSLVMAAQYNHQRQHTNLKLFELGSVFHLNGKKIEEPTHIAALAMGQVEDGYLSTAKEVDYYYMQSIALQVLRQYGMQDISFVRSKLKALHPNQSADIMLKDKVIGSVGMLHPQVALELGLPEVGLCDLNLNSMKEVKVTKAYKPSKYPAIHRDITLSVKPSVMVQTLEQKVKDIPHMISMQLVDIYEQDETTKNVTWRIKFQSDKETLSDQVVTKSMKLLQTQLEG